MKKAFLDLFFTPVDNYKKGIFILLVVIIFIFCPQHPPSDWELNTVGFWSDIPHTYQLNQNFVYPPWGLILLLPYKLMQAWGARILSVLVIGWLVIQQKWSLSTFFAIVLSPYFFVTMSKSNLDILVLVFPILLWRKVDGTRWQNLGWGISLALPLLKPQGAVLIWLFLLWNARKRYKEFLIPILMVTLVTIPVSLIGTPPLFVQWLNNVMHPSAQNEYYWSFNNISLTSKFDFMGALLILMTAAVVLAVLHRTKRLSWTTNHTLAALLFSSMFLSPYTSQQSFVAGLAFVPSWISIGIQAGGLLLGFLLKSFFGYVPLWSLLFAFSSLILFHDPRLRKTENIAVGSKSITRASIEH